VTIVGLDIPFLLGTTRLSVSVSIGVAVYLIEVTLTDGINLAYPIRSWDNYFSIGLYGQLEKERMQEAKAHGINIYVGVWDSQLLDELGFNYVAGAPGIGRVRTREQTGRLFFYSIDEPDSQDAKKSDKVPFMDRLGLSAEIDV
jgi:hypothetical protein